MQQLEYPTLPLDSGTHPEGGHELYLSRSLMENLLSWQLESDELAEVRQHLRSCSHCRKALGDYLEEESAAPSHPARELLQRAERWAQLAAAGKAATRAARAGLHEKGVHPVFMQNGELVEELPDGSTQRISVATISKAQ